jgi:hypothetical protein
MTPEQVNERLDLVLDRLGNKIDARFNALDARFNAIDAKFNAQRLLTLGLILSAIAQIITVLVLHK